MRQIGDMIPPPSQHPFPRGAERAPAASGSLPATHAAETRLAPSTGSGATAIPQHLPTAAMPLAAERYIVAAIAREAERAAFAAATREQREVMHVSPLPRRPDLAPAERAECLRGAEYLARQMQPVSLGHLAAWLSPINASVRNPQSRDDLAVRVRALHEMLGDMPAGAFHVAARRALSPDWFPSAGEIRAAVEPEARKMRANAGWLRSLAAEPEPERAPVPAYPTDAERDAMRAAATARMAELRAAAGERERGKRGVAGKALPLSDGALLTHYERLAEQGNRAAAARADAIRAKMPKEPAHD